MVVPICNKLESEIAELEEDERAEFLAELGFEEPGLNRVIRTGYRLLNLQTYFTAGVQEVRAWTVRVGAKAPEAAGVIHTDFQKGFIRAEVIAYADFVAVQGRTGREGRRQVAPRRQGIRGAGRRRDPLPLQRLGTRRARETVISRARGPAPGIDTIGASAENSRPVAT